MMVGYGGHTTRDTVHGLSYGRRHESTASLIDAIEKRTQKTYRYGIGLVCIGATLNWLGFAQGNSYIDPLRYLGVASVVSGSFCVCLAMCRWLGRPMAGHLSSLEEDSLSSRSSGDVHVFNVAIPMFVSSTSSDGGEYRPSKPPDYDIVAAGEVPPPNYDDAIKLTPGSLMMEQHHHNSPQHSCTQHSYAPPASCGPSPSHSTCPLLISSQDEPSKSTDSTTATPPPPYRPSPTRFSLPSNKILNLNAINNSNLNLNPASLSSVNLITSTNTDNEISRRIIDQMNGRHPLSEEDTTSRILSTSLHVPIILPADISVTVPVIDMQNQNERGRDDFVKISISPDRL